MKNLKLLFVALPAVYMLITFTVILLPIFANAWKDSQPITIVATPEQAWNYQYVGSELGVPWDIVMLSDAIYAKQEMLSGIEDFNPLITALEFCILQEDFYTLEPIYDEEDNVIGEEWVFSETILYHGCDEILSYIGKHRDALDYKDATDIVVDMNKIAEDKCTSDLKCDVTLVGNIDYNFVLHDLLGIDEDSVKGVMELYEAQYMAELYGYMPPKDDFKSIDVPPLVSGSVTRNDLARVAASLMNWPYQLGAKSPYEGKPVGPLDCSGYIDWVYIQCFGIGVSAGGRVPAGVAVSGTAIQYYASDEIEESELKIGDLGFLKNPRDVRPGQYNHVGIYIGEINGRHAWIHCGGSSYGYDERINGRVGISVNAGTNNYNPVSGSTFSPEMKSCNLRYFRRPRFEFAGDIEE